MLKYKFNLISLKKTTSDNLQKLNQYISTSVHQYKLQKLNQYISTNCKS